MKLSQNYYHMQSMQRNHTTHRFSFCFGRLSYFQPPSESVFCLFFRIIHVREIYLICVHGGRRRSIFNKFKRKLMLKENTYFAVDFTKINKKIVEKSRYGRGHLISRLNANDVIAIYFFLMFHVCNFFPISDALHAKVHGRT